MSEQFEWPASFDENVFGKPAAPSADPFPELAPPARSSAPSAPATGNAEAAAEMYRDTYGADAGAKDAGPKDAGPTEDRPQSAIERDPELAEQAKTDPDGAQRRVEDRERAAAELDSKFDVKDNHQEPRKPNQVTPEEYEKIVRQYSDVRTGNSDIKVGPEGEQTKEDEEHKKKTMENLSRLMQTPAGRAVVDGLHRQGDGKTTRILKAGEEGDETKVAGLNGEATEEEKDRVHKGGVSQTVNVTGEGLPKDPHGPALRSDAILMHELTHALHMSKGIQAKGEADSGPIVDRTCALNGQAVMNMEHQATGIGKYANDPITENKYREQRRAMAGSKGSVDTDGDGTMNARGAYHTLFPPTYRCPVVN